jgi:co-chaperonin GroES (HSP10)|tara:strand:+ start:209 stop:694 length:486 start_codon:yes stop_codon:yes gene_type:complete
MNKKVAEKTEFEKHKESLTENQSEGSSELDKAFVSSDQKVLDPTLLDKSLLDRMPNPSGWRLLVLPYKGKGVTEAGIQLVKETVDREALSTVICYVLKIGPLAYKDENKFDNKPWCKKGEWVLIGRYAGTRFRLEDDHEVRIINDDEVIATIFNPDDIKSL